MDKELEEKVRTEAQEYAEKEGIWYRNVWAVNGIEGYKAGTTSPALIEFIVRRAVELAQVTFIRRDDAINYCEVEFERNADEIIELIKKELA